MDKYVFMNKNREILIFTFDSTLGVVTEINEIKNIEYAPYSFKISNDIKISLNEWLASRYGYDSKMNVRRYSYVDELKLKQSIINANGLSLSDQYWFHAIDKDVKWNSINFFDNDFEYKKFIELSFSEQKNEYSKIDMMYSPNSTTGGQLDKVWIIDNNKKRCLLKSSNTMFNTEPINEVIAYEMAKIIELPATKYTNKVIDNLTNNLLVSCCETFINTDTELVPASQIIKYNNTDVLKDTVTKYIRFLEENNVSKAKEKILKQLLLDALLDNTDRHLNNFGIIRDVNTLKIIDVAPNYDCGRSLGTTFAYTPEKYNRNKFNIYEFGYYVQESELLDLIDKDINISRKQYQKLYSLPDKYYNLLKENIDYTSLKEDEVEHLCNVFKENISFIEEYLDKRKCFVEI